MTQENKKITFGFSKTIKKSNLKPAGLENKKIDYIEYIDDKSIKIVDEVEEKDVDLVIPMLNGNSVHKKIVNKVNARKDKANGKSVELNTLLNGIPSLEAQAAQEIIQDLQKDVKVEDTGEHMAIEPTDNITGEQESTLDDYTSTPIEKFGLAMMRGMGWAPTKESGNSSKIQTVDVLNVRPKGLGLGADKVLTKKPARPTSNSEESLSLKKGAYVKISAGKHKNHYGQVEGCDDSTGRVVVKLALVQESVSFNEGLIELVTTADYNKNSKVINSAKYEKYKNRISDLQVSESSDEDAPDRRKSRNRRERSRSRESSKKSKKHKHSHSSRKNKDKERERAKDRHKSDHSKSSERKKQRKHKRSRTRSPERQS